MRVLFATYSEKTHLLPMVPLAWALRTAGHDVRVASQPELVPAITRAGLPATAVGADHHLWRVARRFLTRRVATTDPVLYEKVRGIRQPPFDVADRPDEEISWEHLRSGYAGIVPSWYRLVNDPMIGDLVALARAWRPDLVLWESATFAGAVAAEAVGAAHGRVLCNLDMFGVARRQFLRLKGDRTGDPLAEWLAPLAARHGAAFSEDLVTGHFTVDQQPGSLRMEAGGHRYVPMRHVPYNGPAVVPQWLADGRRRIAVSLGSTSSERFDGFAVGVREILDALADVDAEIVATWAGDGRPVPGNVRLVPFLALHLLAPACAAVVHHGAFGTATAAGLAGVPQLSLPERHDAPYHATRMTRQGAGLAIPHDQATGENVRAALLRLLTEPRFAERAAALRAEMLALPAPNDLVPELERLTAACRPERSAGVRRSA
ncbi:activator-dependent family glycosyltransferase [Herbidospora galbida]|uniref:Activator-dependent family glycosyltransferase n=1 Tax=Herbidospora galbida TaxID=2575442 RepID=A0A4U3MF86_9ACTN|nr:activator-dependent family glycosyltransferase [Herbidospora galbida]TKK87219.1 activator-dependent family glycosyltransferase [Herbidospora galbida]